ncbi:LysR family transcriptional regulator [Gordonia jinhuaensis]|nr:LysR family transcriptional regulator [Gordonia jinhuaensis]
MLDELRWFIAVADQGNLTAAADEVHVSQPTLSRMVARLERELGVALFERTGRGLELTRYGQVYLDRARRANAELDAAKREIDELREPARGGLRLAFLHSFGVELVPELIRRFRAENPGVRFTLFQDAAETVVDHVDAGDADLAIVAPRPMRTDMAWRPIIDQRLALAVPADHRFAERPQIGIAEAADEPFVVMRKGFGMRRILDELCAQAGFEPNITFESTELATVAGLIGAGLGVGILPIEDSPRQPNLVMVPLVGPTREVGLVWQTTRPLPSVAKQFVDFVLNRHTADAATPFTDAPAD